MRAISKFFAGNPIGDALRLAGWRLRSRVGFPAGRRVNVAPEIVAAGHDGPRPASPSEPAVLIEVMLSEGRQALLLRPQIVGNLSADQRSRASAALTRQMALVEAGPVVVLGMVGALADADGGAAGSGRSAAEAIVVEPYFLDRCPVTNREYQRFITAGGYQEQAIWDREVWPVVRDFVDRSGAPGPRFWSAGRFAPGLERHPVVGVSWYEASAYARWLGKRLATDAEWVKAAAMPLVLPGGELRQKRFPWGDKPDRDRANLWGAGPAGTVAVDEFPRGDGGGGVRQMIGNVWEWTSGDVDLEGGTQLWSDGSLRSTAMRSLRGGAFDTYFDSQATCQFQSGDHPLARKHNIGFRCALGVCDLESTNDAALAAGLESSGAMTLETPS